MVFRPNINDQCGNKGSSRPGPSPTSQPLSTTSPSASLRALLHFWYVSTHIPLGTFPHACFPCPIPYCPWDFPWSSPLDSGILWARVVSFCLPSLAPTLGLSAQEELSKYLLKWMFAYSYFQILILKNPNLLEYQLPGLYKELVLTLFDLHFLISWEYE